MYITSFCGGRGGGGDKGVGKKRDNDDNDDKNDDEEDEENEEETEYTSVRQSISKFKVEYGRRTRILVFNIGQDGHDRGSRVIASGFSNLGFDVDVGPLLSTPGEVADRAANSGMHVTEVSSQASGYLSLLLLLRDEPRMGRIRRRTREWGEDKWGAEEEEGEEEDDYTVEVAGGIIPTQDHNFLPGRGENNSSEEIMWCNANFAPGNRITNVAVETQCLTCIKRGGGRR